MPKTKLQDFVFTLVMVAIMVYGMVLYNLAMVMGTLTNDMFLMALEEWPLTFAIAFGVEFLFVGRLAPKITFKAINPRETQPFFITLVMSSVIVMLMCPIMSFIAVFLHGFAGPETIITSWFTILVRNFPMALFFQLFFAGPIVRAIFRPWFNRTK